MNDPTAFTGTKLALIHGKQLITIQRDNKPDLNHADMWDLPGGGREGHETPFETGARETYEELGITLNPAHVIWTSRHQAIIDDTQIGYFFAVRIEQSDIDGIVFGDEGQGWKLIDIQEFLTAANTIPAIQARVQAWVDGNGTPGNNDASS